METSYVNSPTVLTGCATKLSMLKQHEHAYFDALKDYAVHYAKAQAYLADDEWQIAHDYTLIENTMVMDSSLSEPYHGLLGDDGEPAMFAQISDDDIDHCGYMCWLRHWALVTRN